MASGTDSTLLGPRPWTRSDEMPRSWRWISAMVIPARRPSATGLPLRLLGGAAGRQYLHFAAPAPVHRHALTMEIERHLVDVPHVLFRGVVREIAGLADGAVGVILKGRLHPDVPLRGYVVRG